MLEAAPGDVPTGLPDCVALASGCSFEGLLVLERAARIEGFVRGRLQASELLEISAGAVVEGDLEVESLRVAGRVRGVIRARSRVELCASAVVEGEIYAPGIAIAEGCCVDARCRVDTRPEQGVSQASAPSPD